MLNRLLFNRSPQFLLRGVLIILVGVMRLPCPNLLYHLLNFRRLPNFPGLRLQNHKRNPSQRHHPHHLHHLRHQSSPLHPKQFLHTHLFHQLLMAMQDQHRKVGRIRRLFNLLNGMTSLNFSLKSNINLRQMLGILLSLHRRRNQNQNRSIPLYRTSPLLPHPSLWPSCRLSRPKFKSKTLPLGPNRLCLFLPALRFVASTRASIRLLSCLCQLVSPLALTR